MGQWRSQGMEPNPETIELDIHELEALLDRIEATMGEEAVRPLRQVVASYLMVLELLREKNISIQRLRRILFGASTGSRTR